MKIGYARVSTGEQNVRMQIQALQNYGCERIFSDEGVSGNAVIKPAYAEMLAHARAGDEIVVWRLDRMSRSLTTMIEVLKDLGDRDLDFRSLHERIETASPAGRLLFHIVGALAEFERDIIIARTRSGLDAARAEGVRLGRPPKVSPAQWLIAKQVIADNPKDGISRAATLLSISRQAVHARLQKERDQAEGEAQ